MNGFILYPPKMTKFSNQSLLHKPDVTYFKYEILFKYLRKKLKMLKKSYWKMHRKELVYLQVKSNDKKDVIIFYYNIFYVSSCFGRWNLNHWPTREAPM